MTRLTSILCSLALLGTVHPPTRAEAPTPTKRASLEVDADMIKAGFLSSHPDLRYRLLGLNETRLGKHEDALHFFRRASYYGDKPSQGMVAEMNWNGQGTPRDPVQAYIWMDLAAERGYEGFVILREKYWNALSAQQRDQVVQEGQAVYTRYGDAAAQPRLATILRRERREMTGSRTGFAGNLQILIPGPGGYDQIDGTKFFDEKFWDPDLYRAWHDAIWKKPRVGRVSVGEMETVSTDAAPSASRIPAPAPQANADGSGTPADDGSDD